MLSIRSGITRPATLKFRNEEELLAAAADPEAYNRDVSWPDKARINLEYIYHWSLKTDLRYIWRTVVGLLLRHVSRRGSCFRQALVI